MGAGRGGVESRTGLISSGWTGSSLALASSTGAALLVGVSVVGTAVVGVSLGGVASLSFCVSVVCLLGTGLSGS